MRQILDLRLMVDHRAGVQDHVLADHGARLNHGTRKHNRTGTKPNR
jgi:hypothetical protein